MDDSYAGTYHRLEEDHWWFKARRDMIFRLLKGCDRDSAIVEIGCSGGPLISYLRGKGFSNIRGIDISERSISLCRERGIESVRVADGQETGFGDNEFDIVIASDVLEHIEDEDRAIKEWCQILKSGGKLIVFVPAFRFLWSSHDELNYHYRRYSRPELIRKLERNGLLIRRASYWNFILFPLISLIRLITRFFAGKRADAAEQLRQSAPLVNLMLEGLLKIENRVISGGINFPFGVSVFAVAEKR
ncbi:MAG: class I SAM-dependent methyltransferase [Nitrospirae bacterium]|nr:class I SAM-dependent methyltransferase [Nitrospirota bacterium]